MVGGIAAAELIAVGHDMYQRHRVATNINSNITGPATSEPSQSLQQWSPLAIALCDGFNAVLESKQSSFITIDNIISMLLGLAAFAFPNLKGLTNDLHSLQIFKYAGNALRYQDPELKKLLSKEKSFINRFKLETKHSIKKTKDVFKKLPYINRWGKSFVKSPMQFLRANNHNFFLVKAVGELIAGTMILGSDAILYKKSASGDINDNPDSIFHAIRNTGWNLVKGLYFINALAWLASALKPGRSAGYRASELGLATSKGIHAVFAQNPSLAFTSRALERFFYLLTSSYSGKFNKQASLSHNIIKAKKH